MTADTSTVVAALAAWHEQHEEAARALASVGVLPAHAMTESFSVLTRLPAGLAVPPATALDVLVRRFPEPPLTAIAKRPDVLRRLAEAGVAGGAAYDGLVAVEAADNGETLLTLDRRAQRTYERLGVAFVVV